MEQLKKLNELRQSGAISDEEYNNLKKKILEKVWHFGTMAVGGP